jgi:DNA topoisomerase-1
VKTFAESPVTGKAIEIRDGRYGMYITDGETNATLPKDQNPEEVTFEQAITLLAERAAVAPKKKGSRAKAAKKSSKTAAPKAAKKAAKSTKKKATKKKSAKKASEE